MSIRFLFVSLLLLAFSCTSERDNSKGTALEIVGSDTEYDVVRSLLDPYKIQSGDNILLRAGGSTLGINQLIDGEVQMANSSRKISEYELERAADKGVEIEEVKFAFDALAIICHPSLRVDSLSTIELGKIFRGEIKNWKELGYQDLPIKIYGRDEHSGTRRYIENRFVRNEGFSTNHIETKGNKKIIEKVKKDKGGIGYVGVGFIMNSYGMPANDVWAIPVFCEGGKAHSPYELLAVMSNEYDLLRPLYQYVNKKYLDAFADFIAFELSKEGQILVKEAGFYMVDYNQ